MDDINRQSVFRDAQEDSRRARVIPDTPQARSASYKLAFADPEFLLKDELRPVRLQLELLKFEMLMVEHRIKSTVVMFGGARIPAPSAESTAPDQANPELAHFYTVARDFARAVTERSLTGEWEHGGQRENVIVTGGGPGVMEAGNLGAHEAGGVSIGLNIVLPHEQAPNAYVTPELSFNFHYFAIRKMHFLMRANAVAVFPGGFGTLDEMFESLTLIQTGRMRAVPFLLFGEKFWRRVINWEALVEAGTISPEDLDLFRFVETAEQAIEVMAGWQR